MTIPRNLSNLAPGASSTGVLGVSYGGTNLTTLTAANNALYSTSASVLTAGTLPVAAGGTGSTTLTANNVLLGNGTSALQVVAPGTSGNALISNGTTWASSAVPGGWVYLSTVTASAAATADIETTFDSTYDNYVIVATGVSWSATSILGARFKISGSYATTGYSYSTAYSSVGTALAAGNTSGTGTQVNLLPSLGATNAYGFVFYIYSAADTINTKTVSFSVFGGSGGGTSQYQSVGGGGYASGAALTGIRFLMTSGTITGTFRLYGIKNS